MEALGRILGVSRGGLGRSLEKVCQVSPQVSIIVAGLQADLTDHPKTSQDSPETLPGPFCFIEAQIIQVVCILAVSGPMSVSACLTFLCVL